MKKYPFLFFSLIFAVVFVVLPQSVSAADVGQRMKAKVTSDHYFERASYRFLTGAMNLAFSPTQLVVEPYNSVVYEGQDIVNGVFDGLAKTLYFAAMGTWDLATFWFPGESGKELAAKDCVFANFRHPETQQVTA